MLKPKIVALSLGAFIASCGGALAAPAAGSQRAPTANSAPDSAQQQALSSSDKAFLTYAAHDNQAEIRLTLIAIVKASTPQVKAFARLMIDDHAGVETRLARVAEKAQTSAPLGYGKEGRDTIKKLLPLPSSQFDREFIADQVKDHARDVRRYRKEISQTSNPMMREYAAETLPLLEQHLALARAVEQSLTSSEGRSAAAPGRAERRSQAQPSR